MGYNTSSISQYVDQSSKELLAAIVAGSNTFNASSVRVVPGIKAGSAKQMKLFSNTVNYVTSSCPSTVSGATTFVERLLSTDLITVFDGTCSDDIDDKLSIYLPAGASGQGDFDLPTEIVDDILAIVSRDNAKAAWQGGTIATNMLFNTVEGWLYKLKNTAYSAETFGTTAGTFTSANAVAGADALVATIPAALASENFLMHMPAAYFNALKVGLRNANYYNFGAQDDATSFVLPGYSNITVVRDDGMAGATDIVLALADGGDLIWSVDQMSDQEKVEVWYDKTDDKLYHRVKFAVGTEIAYPSQIGILSIG